MKISVVIPVYNEEKLIASCLTALLNQTHAPDEIIVVDNNSTDTSAQIAEKMGVRVVKEPKQGMIYARNRGFESARYPIIARCDADCIPPKDWVKTIVSHFDENTDALTGPIITHDTSPLLAQLYSTVYFRGMRLLQGGKNTLIGPNMSLTKKMWEKIKDTVCLDDSQVHEDIDLAIHINKAGGTIKFDENLLMSTSGRRAQHNPLSFFIEYPVRLIKTVTRHSSARL